MKYVSFSRAVVAAFLLLLITIAKPSVALDNSDSEAKPFAEFDSLTLEQQISLTEKTVYSDQSKIKNLLETIVPRLAAGSKEQRHRVMLLQAYLALAHTNLARAGNLFEQIQLGHPSDSVLARLLYLRAKAAEFRSDYGNAFYYLNEADQLPKERLSKTSQFFLLTLAADLNAFVARYDAAISYSEQSIALARQIDDPDLICFASAGMLTVLVVMENYSALELGSYKAIDACEKSGNKVLLAGAYQDFSHVYFAQGNYKLQQQWLNRAIDILSQNSYPINIPPAKLQLVNSYIADKQLILAESILDELLEFAAPQWSESDMKYLYLAKSSLLEQQELSAQALSYYKKYLAIKDKEIKAGTLIHVAYFQAQFDSKINTQLAKMSDAEQQYDEGISKVGKLEVWLLAVSAALFLSLPMYALSFYHRRKKVSVIKLDKFDDLTSVYNFEQGLQQARVIFESERHHFKYYAVASVDIDSMQAINNSFDYDFGDRLIRAFAMELKTIFAHCGLITRGRRNDFVIFFSTNDETDITYLLSKVHQHLRILMIGSSKPYPSCSIGYAVDTVTPDTDISELCNYLVGQASIALRHSKCSGGDQWTKYEKKLAILYADQDQSSNSLYLTDDDNVAEPF